MPTAPVDWSTAGDTLRSTTTSSAASAAAIVAVASHTTGYARAIEAYSERGYAVYGRAVATDGPAVAVYGDATSSEGAGV